MEKAYLLAFFLLVLATSTYAGGIAISPSNLEFGLYKGEAAESLLTLINPGDKEVAFSLSADKYPDWFTFSEPTGLLEPGESKLIRIRVNPPADYPNGDYSTLLSLAFEDNYVPGQLSLNLATAIKTKVIITGKQLLSLTVTEFKTEDTEQTLPLVIRLGLSNNGNVRTIPAAELILKKSNMILQSSETELPEILPGADSSPLLNLSTASLEPGLYTLLLRLRLNNAVIYEGFTNFQLLPLGTLPRKGELSNLSLQSEPKPGQLTRLSAQFANTGQLNLRARLVSELYLGSKLIGLIEGEEKLVRVGQTEQLLAYFTPPSSGDYLIRARVSYEGEETPLKELSFRIESLSPAKILITLTIALSLMALGLLIISNKEVKRMASNTIRRTLTKTQGKAQDEKTYYCIDCNRPINHKGRCFLCNRTAKLRREAQDRKYA